ncbi:GH92 family glycosyl hydrolase [Schleiferilactobacillus harbinensis]|uniref:GH92 family glycosyl hydrolase n=1 Tax=Schleiferilactobacillus harbinensis TaxID=304207 RepID=UPI0007BA847C|nr:GH92 family glycosyl hydrolase [Schleiferilactobacillus harbinensis]
MLRIDTRQGTASHPDFSHGNTLPLTGVPWGMHYLTVQTNGDRGAWFFDPFSHQFEGIRLTHQPSPWIGDFQHCLFRATTNKAAGTYQPDRATFSPAVIDIYDEPHQLRTQATATARGGALRYTSAAREFTFQIQAPDRWTIVHQDNRGVVLQLQNQTASADPDFSMYLAVSCDTPWHAEDTPLAYTISNSQPVVIHFTASFISAEYAQRALAELERQPFTKLVAANTAEWEKKMALFTVQDHHADRVQTFYTSWYRSLLFPMRFYEYDAAGGPVHYSTTERRALPGRLYTNTGFWDTYKTTFPLLALVQPTQYGYFLEGFLNSAKETGYLPKWLSPDERAMMPGTMADAVVADAVDKDIRPDLWPDLLTAMVHGAETPSDDPHYGRPNLKDYQTLGYVPADIPESVNQTLDYAYSDALIGVVATKLQRPDITEDYAPRGQNYRHLFDPKFGLMHPKSRTGTFLNSFNPYTWGQGFTEGSAWQNSFAVYQDIPGLIDLAGGPQAFLHTLHTLANAAPRYNVGSYHGVIHEMAEMSAIDFGQIAISNQPSIHIPYLFALAGEPASTELLVKQLLLHAFNAGPAGFPGDEDNGSMSSWYIWSALGLYPLRPGFGDYVFGIPLFDEVTIQLPTGPLTLTTQRNQDYRLFVDARQRDDRTVTGPTITHRDLLATWQLTTTLGLLPKG